MGFPFLPKTSDLSSLIFSNSSLDWISRQDPIAEQRQGLVFDFATQLLLASLPLVLKLSLVQLGDRLLARNNSQKGKEHLLSLTKIRFTREGLAESKGCIGYRSRGCPLMIHSLVKACYQDFTARTSCLILEQYRTKVFLLISLQNC